MKLICFLAAGAVLCATIQELVAQSPLDAATLRARVERIANDSTFGRLTGTEHAARVQRVLASAIAAIGTQAILKGGALLQDVPARYVRLSDSSRLSLTPNPYDESWGFGRASYGVGNDFLPVVGANGLRFPRSADVREARLVFGGRLGTKNLIAPALAIGKVVVLLAPVRDDGLPDYQIWRFHEELATLRQAAAVLVAAADVVPPGAFAQFTDPTLELPGNRSSDRSLPPVALVSRVAASVLLHVPVDAPPIGFSPGHTTATVKFGMTVEPPKAAIQNVVGVIPGTDPKLRSEYLVLLAHSDHLGTAKALYHLRGDSIYNGARAATGTTAVWSIAQEILSTAKPLKRSILVLFETGRTQGYLGSTWFLESGMVPVNKVVAVIDIGSIARQPSNPPLVDLPIRSSSHPTVQLSDMLTRINSSFGFRLVDAGRGTPASVGGRCISGSPFESRGITVVGLGDRNDSDELDDDVESIDFAAVARVVKFAAALTIELADAGSIPSIIPRDVPKDRCVP